MQNIFDFEKKIWVVFFTVPREFRNKCFEGKSESTRQALSSVSVPNQTIVGVGLVNTFPIHMIKYIKLDILNAFWGKNNRNWDSDKTFKVQDELCEVASNSLMDWDLSEY